MQNKGESWTDMVVRELDAYYKALGEDDKRSHVATLVYLASQEILLLKLQRDKARAEAKKSLHEAMTTLIKESCADAD